MHTYPPRAIKPSANLQSEALYCITKLPVYNFQTLRMTVPRTRGTHRCGEAALGIATSAGPSRARKHQTLISSFLADYAEALHSFIAGNTKAFWTLNYLFMYESFNQ